MTRTNLPESATVINGSEIHFVDGKRAEQILNALIVSTSQVDYDEVTIEKLISEYEQLMC